MLRAILFFIVLVFVTSFLANDLKVPFGTVDFFVNHGILFLVFLAFFPRLTLIFSSVATGGLLWWLGWFFFPRVLVAVLATFAYAQTNPFLVTISWLVALGGESAEKYGLYRAKG